MINKEKCEVDVKISGFIKPAQQRHIIEGEKEIKIIEDIISE